VGGRMGSMMSLGVSIMVSIGASIPCFGLSVKGKMSRSSNVL
jgi:hypothetical protein